MEQGLGGRHPPLWVVPKAGAVLKRRFMPHPTARRWVFKDSIVSIVSVGIPTYAGMKTGF